MHFVKSMRTISLPLLFTALLSIILMVAVSQTVPESMPADVQDQNAAYAVVPRSDSQKFSCYTYDNMGNRINAYRSDKDDIWYLFVPSTVEISEIILYRADSVGEISTNGEQINENISQIAGVFAQNGDSITFENADGTDCTVQVRQSGLPSVHIILNGTTLDDVHADREAKHPGNSIFVMDPNGDHNLMVENTVEIKGRGNSTWVFFDKKGYQIKFNSKIPVLGMNKAKKWVLLANAGDDSLMRNALTYRLAEKMDMDFVPDLEYVDLWINGEYFGNYTIGEKAEIGSSRLNLQENMGVLVELDDGFYMRENHWFYSKTMNRYFAMKEIVVENNECIETAMADFEASVDDLMEFLYAASPYSTTLEELSAMIDVDSFAKYYLIAEYVLNREGLHSSFYWYKDGLRDVLHLGPIWDYDSCMGNYLENDENYAHHHILFRYLLSIPAFYDRVQELKEQYQPYLENMSADADVIRDMIEDSADMNFRRWDVFGKPNPKYNLIDYQDSFDDAVNYVKTWLENREDTFQVMKTNPVHCKIHDNGRKMDVFFDDAGIYSNMRFAVWGESGGQNDLVWYPAARDGEGLMRVTVDLTHHRETGNYLIHVYSDDQIIVTGSVYVE